MKVVISGYYGFNNSGDDALLKAIVDNIKSVDQLAKITVLSNSPKETKKIYNVNATYRYNPFSVLWEIATCDLLISGGGTLIQDATSSKSLYYYLSIIKIAKMFKRKVMLYANGIGPLTSFKNIYRTKNILNTVDVITLRDENSKTELEQLGVSEPEIHVTADPAFLLCADEKGNDILVNYGMDNEEKFLCVSVRKAKNNPKDFEQIMADFCDYAYEEYGLTTVFLPMQRKVDYTISAAIKNKMKNKGVVIGANYPVSSTLSLISKMYVCVGMRLHTLIYSSNVGVPVIGIVYDPKVSGFLDYMGEEKYVSSEDVTREKLCEYLDKVCKEYETIKSDMDLNVRILRGKSEENVAHLRELLNGGK